MSSAIQALDNAIRDLIARATSNDDSPVMKKFITPIMDNLRGKNTQLHSQLASKTAKLAAAVKLLEEQQIQIQTLEVQLEPEVVTE